MTDIIKVVCTKDNPYTREPLVSGIQVIHPDAVSEDCGDYYDCYTCPYCGIFFKVELPE